MDFQSSDRIYQIINLIAGYDEYDTYLCRCAGVEYIMLCLKSNEIKKDGFRLFTELSEDSDFSDIKEIFVDRGIVCIVFIIEKPDIRLGMPDENMTFKEKLDILYEILSGLCMRGIPVVLVCDMLKNLNIGVKSDGNAAFYYNLHEVTQLTSYSMSNFCTLLSEAVKKLFVDEARAGITAELDSFLSDISINTPEDYLELFRRYKRVYSSLTQKIKEGKIEYSPPSIKAWEKFKTIFAVAIKLAVAAVIILAVAVLIKSLFTKNSGSSTIETIGTLSIEEYSSDSE